MNLSNTKLTYAIQSDCIHITDKFPLFTVFMHAMIPRILIIPIFGKKM